MDILADLHHAELYESLCILFEDRLGHRLFRPIGLEWWHENFWCVYNSPDTAKQYLDMGPPDPDGDPHTPHGRLAFRKSAGAYAAGDGTFRWDDPEYGRTHKCVTLATAKNMDWDLVLSTTYDHFFLYEDFRQKFAPQAKHVFQMGNMWTPPKAARNILNSTTSNCGDRHTVNYHQEFRRDLYNFEPCQNPQSIANFMHYQQEPYSNLWDELRSLLPHWKFSNFGAGNADGVVWTPDLPREVKDHGFLWHNKPGGEGYGYVVHHSIAAGRPIFMDRRPYRGLTAEKLFKPSVSCVDIHGLSPEEIARELEVMAANHEELGHHTAQIFDDNVDFDTEAEHVCAFLSNLV